MNPRAAWQVVWLTVLLVGPKSSIDQVHRPLICTRYRICTRQFGIAWTEYALSDHLLYTCVQVCLTG